MSKPKGRTMYKIRRFILVPVMKYGAGEVKESCAWGFAVGVLGAVAYLAGLGIWDRWGGGAGIPHGMQQWTACVVSIVVAGTVGVICGYFMPGVMESMDKADKKEEERIDRLVEKGELCCFCRSHSPDEDGLCWNCSEERKWW